MAGIPNTPDLMGMGVPVEQPGPSIVDSINTPTFPQSALAPLMSALVSPGQMYASALAGGVAQMQGRPNPVQAQMAQQQQSAMGLMNMFMEQQRMRQREVVERQRLEFERARILNEERRIRNSEATEKARTKREEEQLSLTRGNALVAIGTKGLDHDNPEVRKWAAGNLLTGMQAILGPEGGKAPSALIDGLATKELDPKTVEDIQKRHTLGFSEKSIYAAYPHLTPQQYADITTFNTSDPRIVAMFGLKTADDIKKSAAETRLKEAQAIEAEHPELKGKPEVTQRMYMVAQEMFDKSYTDPSLTREQRRRVFTYAKSLVQEDEIKEFERKQNIIKAKQSDLLRQGIQIREEEKKNELVAETSRLFVNRKGEPALPEMTIGSLPAKGYFEIKPDEAKVNAKSLRAATMLQNMRDTVNAAETNNLLVKHGGLYGEYERLKNLATLKMGDPKKGRAILRTMEGQKSELIALLREIGDVMRAQASFQDAINSFESAAGGSAIRATLGKIENVLRSTVKTSRTPGLLEDMPRAFPSIGEAEVPRRSPLAPPAPQGVYDPATGKLELFR